MLELLTNHDAPQWLLLVAKIIATVGIVVCGAGVFLLLILLISTIGHKK